MPQGRLTMGVAPAGRQPVGRGTARKGCHLQGRGGRPLTGWLPTGNGNCCLRRGGDDGDVARAESSSLSSMAATSHVAKSPGCMGNLGGYGFLVTK
ncbi:hypothetical protein GW17_00043033, partial [Ensete ventricosum]